MVLIIRLFGVIIPAVNDGYPYLSIWTDISLSSYNVTDTSISGTTIGSLSVLDPGSLTTANFSLPSGQKENSKFDIGSRRNFFEY
jgi:hypothetical protein